MSVINRARMKKNEVMADMQDMAEKLECYTLSVDGYAFRFNQDAYQKVLSPVETSEGVRLSNSGKKDTPREAIQQFYEKNSQLGREIFENADAISGTLNISDRHFEKLLEEGKIEDYHASLDYSPETGSFSVFCAVKEDGEYREQVWWEEAVETVLDPEKSFSHAPRQLSSSFTDFASDSGPAAE